MGFLDIFKNNNEEIEERAFAGISGISSLSSIITNGTDISLEKVEKIPSVQACTNIICSTIAALPIYLYKEDEDGDIIRVQNDNREFLLNVEANGTQNAFNLKKQFIKDYLFFGAGYIKVDWEGNEVSELWNLEADKVVLKKYINGYKTSSTIEYMNGYSNIELDVDEVVMALKDSKDGIIAKGLLETGKDIFQIALSQIEYTSRVYNKGALPLGVLKAKNKLSLDALNKLKNSWNNLYSGSSNSAKTVILEEGLEYSPISLNPADLDLANAKKEINAEICRLFQVPESLINSSANKYGSVTQNNVHYLQYTLSPILTAVENAFNKALLLEEEKKAGYFWLFDTSEVLKSTEKEKYETIKLALDSGLVSMNEARVKLNMNKMNTNYFKWSLGSVLYDDETGDLIVPNTLTNTNTNDGINKINSNSKEVKEDGNVDDSIKESDEALE